MQTLLMCVLLVVAAVHAVGAQNVAPRRDDDWPPRDFLDELKPIRIECRQKVPEVTDEAIQRFSDVEAHEDQPLKCYMSCLFHEFRMTDDDGEAHFEKILQRLPQSMQAVAQKMLAECEHPKGGDLCERAFSLHKCFKRVDPVHYFLV